MDAYPSHDYPITFSEIKNVGLPAEQMQDDVNDFMEELLSHYECISHPFYEIQQNHTVTHEQGVIIETLGRRTSYYEERLRRDDRNEVIEEHSHWRQLTEEFSLAADGSEKSDLKWTELALSHRVSE